MHMETFAYSKREKALKLSTQVRRQSGTMHSPFCTLAGGAEVGISQPIDSKTKHIIRFQSFAEQITVTTTILGGNKGQEKHQLLFAWEPRREGAFHQSLFHCLWGWSLYAKSLCLKTSAWLTSGNWQAQGLPLVATQLCPKLKHTSVFLHLGWGGATGRSQL